MPVFFRQLKHRAFFFFGGPSCRGGSPAPAAATGVVAVAVAEELDSSKFTGVAGTLSLVFTSATGLATGNIGAADAAEVADEAGAAPAPGDVAGGGCTVPFSDASSRAHLEQRLSFAALPASIDQTCIRQQSNHATICGVRREPRID